MTLIDKAEALLPCPFCGGEGDVMAPEDALVKLAMVMCMDCYAIGPERKTEAEAIAAWNRRAAIPARGVKPLEWEGDETELHDLIARPDPFHTYTVRPLGELRFDVILNHELGSLWFRQRKGEIWPDYASAKAAAQADYEARILAALAPTDAAHVNETPKSEHDGDDVLTDMAAQAREAALSVLSGLSSYLGTGLGDDDTTAEQFDKRIRWAIDDLTARTRQAALREAAAEVQRWFHDGRDNRDPAALILALIGEANT